MHAKNSYSAAHQLGPARASTTLPCLWSSATFNLLEDEVDEQTVAHWQWLLGRTSGGDGDCISSVLSGSSDTVASAI